MPLLQNLVPMRWPSGPLEIVRRRGTRELTEAATKVLERWHDPAALEIVKDSPINCLVVSWAAGMPEDAGQQKSAAPLIDAALNRKLAVIGWVEGQADHDAAIAAAKAAGLSAVAIQGFRGKSDFTVIPWGARANAPWESTAPFLAITDNVWPGVRARQGGGTNAGPTTLPWVDSNGWYVQLARARTRSDIWVVFEPPGSRNVISPQAYPMAIADAEAAGARWVVSLDDDLRARLTTGDAAARETWRGIASAAAFFEKRREWRSYTSLGEVGVISDFTGGNFDMSGEILNLMSRLGTPLRVLWRNRAASVSFAGLKALVYADSEPPPEELRQKMLAFVQSGGLLVTGPKWGREGKATAESHLRFEVRALGKGRLALAREDLVDPYQVSLDTQILLSHANDMVRFFGTGASACYHYTGSPDGKRRLLQVLTYARGRGVTQVTAWVRHTVRGARLWSLQEAGPVTLVPAAAENGGTEFHIPQMPAYAALELDL